MENNFYSKVFMWLFVGLLITFGVGYASLYSEAMIRFVLGSGSIIIFIAQIALCVFWMARLHKMQLNTAKICYLSYSVLTGLTFSTIFLLFQVESIIYVLLVTAVLFGLFALIGKCTKIDLSKFSTYLFIGLIGIILLELVNIFLTNNTLDMALCCISIIIFLGYTAYDMQRLKSMEEFGDEKYAILGAFELYLDFINLFLDLLRLFGKQNDN